MIQAPGILMIGSGGKDSGKTLLSCSLVERCARQTPVVAAKVTAISEREGPCPRGGGGCGVCASLEGKFYITEEAEAGPGKDTQRLLAAGASKVYWLRVSKDHLAEGAAALLETVGTKTPVICESNSLRTVVDPGLFLMVRRRGAREMKASARAVEGLADAAIRFDGQTFDLDLARIRPLGGRWALRYDAAAIVLAGGKSRRMREDKSLMLLDGKPMIERVCAQLEPHFDRILISANNPAKYAFLGLPIWPDSVPDQGPLRGIASALEASRHDLNLVVACDIPEVNVPVVRRMLREARDCDGVAPRTASGQLEPLFAVYRKRMLPAIRAALDAGERKVIAPFDRCDVRRVDVGEPPWLRNLNTREDYEEFLKESARARV